MHRLRCSSIFLQSHYSNRLSPDGRWANIGNIERRRPIVGWHRHRYLPIFWSANAFFFVEAPKLKVSLADLSIFRDFVIVETSGNGRHFISWNRPKVASSSGVNRPTITRRSVDNILSNNRRKTDARYRPSFGQLSPDCRPIINFGTSMCHIV